MTSDERPRYSEDLADQRPCVQAFLSELGAAVREQHKRTVEELERRAAADELARLTNDMGLYGDQEAK